jgi:sporulation protein YlmC with PRC-barrel domain
MLHRASRLEGATVQGTDGDIGKVSNLYFDDRQWKISHLGVRTDLAQTAEGMLLSPSRISPHWDVATLPADLSRQELEKNPAAGDGVGTASSDGGAERDTRMLKGLHIEATDGEIGHVDDLLIDEASWRIGYLVVDTSNWIGGKWVAISPSVLRGVDWDTGKVEVAITREAVKQSPLMDSMPVPTAETMPPFILL